MEYFYDYFIDYFLKLDYYAYAMIAFALVGLSIILGRAASDKDDERKSLQKTLTPEHPQYSSLDKAINSIRTKQTIVIIASFVFMALAGCRWIYNTDEMKFTVDRHLQKMSWIDVAGTTIEYDSIKTHGRFNDAVSVEIGYHMLLTYPEDISSLSVRYESPAQFFESFIEPYMHQITTMTCIDYTAYLSYTAKRGEFINVLRKRSVHGLPKHMFRYSNDESFQTYGIRAQNHHVTILYERSFRERIEQMNMAQKAKLEAEYELEEVERLKAQEQQ